MYILILNLTKHHCILLELATLIYTPRVGHRILAFLEFLPTINSTKVSHFLANNGYKVESHFLFLISPVLSLSISSLTCCGLLSFAPLSDLANLPLVLIKFTQVHTDLHPVFLFSRFSRHLLVILINEIALWRLSTVYQSYIYARIHPS